MAAGAARGRLGAWFTEQVQARSDGFLVRPLGWLGRVVVLPDEAAVSQYVARRVSLTHCELAGRCLYVSFFFAAMATAFLDFQAARALLGSPTRFAAILAAIVGVVIGAPWLARWQIYRWARRIGRLVPDVRWNGKPPSEVVPIPLLPGWFIVLIVMLAGFGGTAFAGAMAWNFSRFSLDGSVGLFGWLCVAFVIGCCWTVSVHAAWQWWRANRRAYRQG